MDFNLLVKHGIRSICILVVSFCANAQEGTTPKLLLEFGYSFRSTGLQGMSPNPYFPISWEKNLQGSRGKLGVGYRIFPKIELRYAAGIHYDHTRRGGQGSGVSEYKDWFLDHNFGVRYYPSKTGLLSRYFIFEVSRINSNSDFKYSWDGEWRSYNLAFTAVGVGVGFRVWKLILEPRISMSDFGNPYNAYNGFTFISIDLLYRIRLMRQDQNNSEK